MGPERKTVGRRRSWKLDLLRMIRNTTFTSTVNHILPSLRTCDYSSVGQKRYSVTRSSPMDENCCLSLSLGFLFLNTLLITPGIVETFPTSLVVFFFLQILVRRLSKTTPLTEWAVSVVVFLIYGRGKELHGPGMSFRSFYGRLTVLDTVYGHCIDVPYDPLL